MSIDGRKNYEKSERKRMNKKNEGNRKEKKEKKKRKRKKEKDQSLKIHGSNIKADNEEIYVLVWLP